MMLSDLRALLCKIEGTEGTDPTPTGASNAFLVYDMAITPIAGSMLQRPLSFPNFGSVPAILAGKHVMVSFKVPLSGAGAAGTAPAYGPVLRACGMAETITASTKVVYSLISSAYESVTLYAHENAIKHKLTGARGTAKLVFQKNELPYIDVALIGRWNAAAAASLPSVTVSAWIDPLPVSQVNTPTYTLDSYAAVLESLTVDLGQKAVHRTLPNSEYVAITGRQVTGDMEIEAIALGTKDYLAAVVAQTLMVEVLTHGTVAGNIVQIDAPKKQLLLPSYNAVDGVRTIKFGTQYNRNAGDDEVTLTVK